MIILFEVCHVKGRLKFISFAFLMGFISILKLHMHLTFPLHSTAIELSQGMWTITGTEDSEENGAQGGPLPAWETDSNYKKKA